jgi:hypothetical protein
LNKFISDLRPGFRLQCDGCGFSQIISQKGLDEISEIGAAILIQEFKFLSSVIVCPECYQPSANVVRSLVLDDALKSELSQQFFETEGLCSSCKFLKENDKKFFCRPLNKEIISLRDVASCFYYSSHYQSFSPKVRSIDQDMQQKSFEPQGPDKFATDTFKFFNKVKRK